MPQTSSVPTDPITLDPLLTRSDLERLLQVGERTIRRWVSIGKFPRPIQLNGTHRWRMKDVRAYLDQLAETESAATEPANTPQ